jgi:DNA-binding MarR family transcriptional regulator
MTAPARTVPVAPAGTGPTPDQVAQVRAFNRFYTNLIGVLPGLYLDTPYTLTESRLLFEVARHGTVGVSALRQALDIDARYLGRVLSRFAADGLVTRQRSAVDARRQEVGVTPAGRAAVAELDRRAAAQIGALLGRVDCAPLLDAMAVITRALGQPEPAAAEPAARPAAQAGRVVTLRPLRNGDLGWILHRHGHPLRRGIRLGRHLRSVLRHHHRRVRRPEAQSPRPHRGMDRRSGRGARRLGLLRPRQRSH